MDNRWIALIFIAPLIGLLIFATVSKYMEVRRARKWKSTPGRIVRSKAVQRDVRKVKDTATRREIRNFAAVAYEFKVSASPYTGERVSIAEDIGNMDVATTLARYPVGKIVTVHYDPNAPEHAVLERELPRGSFLIISAFIAGLAFFAVAAVFGIGALAARLATVIARPSATPLVMGLIVFAVFLFLFARMARAETAVARWRETEGEIVHSDFDTYRVFGTSKGPAPVKVTVHSPRIIYSYVVDGIRYKSERVSVGVYKHATAKALVGRDVRRLRTGNKVTVYYDSSNPAEAVLDRSDWRASILYAASAAFAVSALAVSLWP